MRLLQLSALLLTVSLSWMALAGEPTTFGAPLPMDGDVVSVAVAAADPEAYAGKPHRFSGRITEVCQKEGCWLMLEDNGHAARVMMRDHGFAVSKDATGHAEVFGVLTVKQLSKEAAQHMADDAGKPTSAMPERELRIDASGVRIDG